MLKGYVVRDRGKTLRELRDEEKHLCDILPGEQLHGAEFLRDLPLPASKVLASLITLELRGVVRQAEEKGSHLIL